jgi:hypothetical protein
VRGAPRTPWPFPRTAAAGGTPTRRSRAPASPRPPVSRFGGRWSRGNPWSTAGFTRSSGTGAVTVRRRAKLALHETTFATVEVCRTTRDSGHGSEPPGGLPYIGYQDIMCFDI